MSKKEFLAQLRKGLSGLPKEDIEERLAFYSEMIEDRMEEGLSQEEAVMAAGDAAEIAAQIVADTPLLIIAKERIRPRRRLNLWEVVLLALGSPIWLSLGIAAAAVILSLYVSFWAVIVSLWAVFASFAVCAVGGILACVVFIAGGKNASGFAMLAAGIICSGLSILLFMGCKAVSKGTLILTKKSVLWAKNSFIKKEEA
ncbi:MAG: DUF1700 domain-containing protein [Clostridia bacterium]|nr:DUF1700 domain-containing protein [Clostridia bacterium]